MSLYFFRFQMVGVEESGSKRQEEEELGFEENSFCSHCAASQLSPLPSRGRGKYPPVRTMVLEGLQAPLLGEQLSSEEEEEAGREGGRDREMCRASAMS